MVLQPFLLLAFGSKDRKWPAWFSLRTLLYNKCNPLVNVAINFCLDLFLPSIKKKRKSVKGERVMYLHLLSVFRRNSALSG